MTDPIETIRIYSPAGQAYYSDAAKTSVEFPVTNSCERSAKLMGDDYVRLVFKLPNKVVFDTYAFIEYDGQTFFLKETYRPTPKGCLKETVNGKEVVSSAYYDYDVKFVSIANMLTKPICYRHVVVKGAGGTQQTWDEPEISINGTLETLYQIIIGSIQQAASRLSASHYKDMLTSIATNGAFTNGAKPNGVQLTPNTKLVTFSFSGDNIANVCTSVANAYTEDGKDTEWYITEDAKHSCTLHFAKCESADTAQVLSDYEWENNGTDRFARPYLNGGLKSVEYAQAWSDVPQVIVPYGADRNMSGISVVGIDETTQMQSTFGKRLRLDPNTTYNVHDKNGENAATITTDAHGAISNPNVNTGIEVTKFYNDIYPQCHFKITKVEVKNKRQSGETVPEYTCEGIAVDARYTKEYLAQKGMFPLRIEEATTLSVRFESGFLNGREFEIANKTHKDQDSTGYSLKFTIVADGSIEDGTLIPSGNFCPREGDQFALFNMKMPTEFINLAKQDLAQRAYEELLDLQNTRPEVKCTSEPFTFMQHTVTFGAIMQVSSELFGDKPFISRVIAYSYKLTSPSSVQFSLASAVMQGTLSEMNNAISDVTHTAGGLEQRAINLSRRGWRDANEVADMLDSITSEMMLVGNERYQFGFTSSIECVDSSNKFASLRVGYGSLQHTQEPYINYANKGLWEISGATLTKDVNGAALDPNTPYYLFAQVADDTNPARLILTTDAHSSESEDDVPYLLLGILSSEFEGRRVFSRTNGYTAIEGGTITTEQIQDASRNLIIDFQSNPPRIIARNGAEIIGNVRFKASDTKTAEEQLRDLGIDVGNAQSTADDAKADAAAAQAEAVKVRGEFQDAIAKQENAMNTAIAGVQSSIGSLQNQIDGEVTAWFLKGVPTLNNQPAIDWKVYKADGTLDNDATNAEYLRHEGDTYTNMSSYEEDSENAGKSWRFCKGLNDDPTTTWHWHLIADSDAVKALVEAGKAQSTADGKSTTFVKKPTNYQVGDLWILQTDSDHAAGKKGDILTANQSSATYNASHWSKDVKYTDDTAANAAKTAADNAKKAADAAQADATQALTNLAEVNKDGRVYISEMKSLAVELENIKQEKIQLVGTDGKGGEAQKWDASVNQNAYITAYNACVKALAYYTTESNAQNGYIAIITDTNNQYSWNKITAYYSARQVLVNAIADAANKYSDSIKTTADKAVTDAANAKSAADDAKSVADAATTRLNNWAADGVISPVEKQGIKDEIARIDADKSQITAEYTKYGLGTPAAFNTAHTNYRAVLVTLSANNPENIAIPADFSTKQTAYYTARTTALNAISTKADEVANAYADKVSANAAKAALDNLEIGGENLYIGDNPLTIAADSTTNYKYERLVSGLENNASYVFSCGKSVVKAGSTTKYAVLLINFTTYDFTQAHQLPVGTTRVEQAFTIPSTGTWDMIIYSGVNGSTAGISMEYTDIMVQKGNKATEYQKPIRKFLYNGNVSIPYKITDYAQSKLLASGVYAGAYYTEMASESKGAGVTTANRDAFMNSCLVWFVAGKYQTTENVLKITDWGEAVNISQRADVYVYTGQAAFVESHIQDPTSTGVEFAANGTWTISGVQISTYKMEYLEGEAYEAKTKAEALDYLKAAMANGSTEVAGGLLMTNVLMLRDLANKVTAGLSGMTKYKPSGSSTTLEDLVLLWGGATYDEAFYAARNAGYLKKAGGDPITTLLKKDGTGKIGIFQIDDSKVAIKTADGSIVIDIGGSNSNGGIYVYDKYAICRIVISQEKSISEYFGQQASCVAAQAGVSDIIGDDFTNLKEAPTGGIPQTPFDAVPDIPDTVSHYPLSAICEDGFISAKSKDKFFVIDNSGSTQKIYAKGLATTKGTSGSGELYVSKDFIDAFKDLCSTLYTAFVDVRFVGNNKDHISKIQTALNNVKSKLDVTSIMASS